MRLALPRFFSGRQIVKILTKKYGFVEISTKGSHLKMRKNKDGIIVTVIIPLHNEILSGTFRSILKQARIEKDDFLLKIRE